MKTRWVMTLAMLAVVHISCGRSSGSQDRASCTSESVCGEAVTLAEGGNASEPSVARPFTGSADSVELLYFYGKQRCATCLAIEKETRTVVETTLADRLRAGTVVLRMIDISREENAALVEKYGVSWSSLLVVAHRGGEEATRDMTSFAFGKARKSPEEFRRGVVEAVNRMLEE